VSGRHCKRYTYASPKTDRSVGERSGRISGADHVQPISVFYGTYDSPGPIGFRLAHELEGLLAGVRADGVVTDRETARIRRWLDANREFADVRPFSELAAHLEHALADGVISPDECDDLLFVVQKLTTVNPHFSAIRSGIQVLTGLLNAMAADREISAEEARALSTWIDDWSHLRGLWPFDECEALTVATLSGRSPTDAARHLLALCDQFPVAGHQSAADNIPCLVTGICAVAPVIQFAGKIFVVTGESAKGTRDVVEAFVSRRGGTTKRTVTDEVDYVVVCTGGSPHWAFSCYGRKVEKAYDMRRQGHRISLVHEADVWDA
jgi:hypothetical protein